MNSKIPLPILSGVEKPAQYLGGEVNSVTKAEDQVDLHFALAFPDTYEIGMSHLGLQIIYSIINADPTAWAQRVFMPLPDMEEQLRANALPLMSLEGQRPLSRFDIVGFSLQYELCGTNILAMLELGGIPIFSKDRTENDPIVLGGGPYSYHPEPFADFFDAFFLGDAELAINEILQAVRHSKALKESRLQLLERLHQIEGMYIPSFFKPKFASDGTFEGVEALDLNKAVVTRRLLPQMENAPYVSKPVIPNIRTVHNRLSIEVMRGCVRGCRFCQAGYLYRPQRERSPEEILKMIETALPESGFEELSLLSLSTADYCSIVPLLKALMNRYGEGDQLSISFPSTRVDALTPEVLEQVQRVRRTGFTVAPEAGTQRLRNVINKGVSDAEILTTCRNVFQMGWTGIKLYFMLGLPTETDDDLRGIIELAKEIRSLPEARGKDITVSVSTHVPKPHTPFQWAQQICAEETIRRQRLLAQGLREARVKFRYHDSFLSFLEGVFCRGGRELSAVLYRAYQLGCRLDAWDEYIREELWTQAFLDSGVDAGYYLRERDTTEALPWDHLSCDIPKTYFLKEYQRALRYKETPDCLTQSCSICGACDYDVRKNVLWPREQTEQRLSNLLNQTPAETPAPIVRIRLQYEKTGLYSFLGHLELVSVFHRAFRRTNLPLAYSLGFHPLPRLAFGPPLQLGISSCTEFVDGYFTELVEPEAVKLALNVVLPEGLSVLSTQVISLNAPSIQASTTAATYQVRFLAEAKLDLSLTQEIIRETRDTDQRGREGNRRDRKKAKMAKSFVLRDFVSQLVLDEDGNGFTFRLRIIPGQAGPRPLEIVTALCSLKVGEISLDKVSTELQPSSKQTEDSRPAALITSSPLGSYADSPLFPEGSNPALDGTNPGPQVLV